MLRIVVENALPRLPNVWLGTSVENADYKNRITLLRKVPAQVRFISFEPPLGPIGRVSLNAIHWAIIGGESGPRARPVEPAVDRRNPRPMPRNRHGLFLQ